MSDYITDGIVPYFKIYKRFRKWCVGRHERSLLNAKIIYSVHFFLFFNESSSQQHEILNLSFTNLDLANISELFSAYPNESQKFRLDERNMTLDGCIYYDVTCINFFSPHFVIKVVYTSWLWLPLLNKSPSYQIK